MICWDPMDTVIAPKMNKSKQSHLISHTETKRSPTKSTFVLTHEGGIGAKGMLMPLFCFRSYFMTTTP